MPRFPRSFIKTSYYHVITQGINKSYIFNTNEDIKYYIKSIYDCADKNNIKVIAFCIMNNHAHLLLNTPKVEFLSKYMHGLNTRYGMYYNKKYNRVGYVFRDRYKSEGIYSENHLFNCINYIYNNPVKAGICNHPKEYPYSNYKEIKNNVNEEFEFIDIDEDEEDEEIINKFMSDNNLEISKVIENKDELKRVIIQLKRDKKISLRSISRILKINREVVRKIYNVK